MSSTRSTSQWEAMETQAAKVPEYAYEWAESSIALCAHLAHWSPAFGWGYKPKSYQATNGDLVDIAGTWARLAKHRADYTTLLKNGAIIGPSDMMSPGHRLLGFAEGAGGRAVQSAATTVTATRAELGEEDQYAGHVLFPYPPDKKQKNKDMYYDIGDAGS